MRTLGFGLLVGMLLATQGCATIIRGDIQSVTVQSQTPDVRVEIDGQVGKLGTYELDRAHVHVIRAEAPGYDPLEVTVYPQLNDDWLFGEQCTMWPILWLPMAFDYNLGALNDLPSPIDLKLTKSKEAPKDASGAPSTTIPVAEIKETKVVLRKQPPQPDSVRQARTARLVYVAPENN